MMRVPGRKDSGVIFTTVTELLPNDRLERSERERPSGNGLQRSRDETTHFREQEEVRMDRDKQEAGRRKTKEIGTPKTLKNSGTT